jgi:acetoin utilization protein AcuC
MGDTPVTKGIFEASCQVVGGSICGADKIMRGELIHAFNPGGGLHHAKSDSASGFCIFNDIVIATRFLQRKYGLKRIAIVDVDGHHGDGTQSILYDEPILKISLHRYGIFPGTGLVEEIGEGAGRGYSVNIPLPGECGDDAFTKAFHEVIPPLLAEYQPQLLINQFGVDGHYQDPLVDLQLTTFTYEEVAVSMHELAHRLCGGRYLVLGGGGYQPKNVARCWAIMFLALLERRASKESGLSGLHDPEPTSSNEYVRESVEKTVRKVKETIFPIHGIS